MKPGNDIPIESSSAKRLVVVAPGLGLTPAIWTPLIARLKLEPYYLDNQTDWLLFDHGVGPFSFGRLDSRAMDLRARIDEKWIAAGGYGDIVLAGHSIGGLMVRQAYLSAGGALPGSPVAAPWFSKVSRIVLLAAPNSGVSKYQRLNRMSQGLAGAAGLRFVVSDVFRGSDFIANLRINWIRFFSTLSTPPIVFQFRGAYDSVIKESDSDDVLAFPNSEPQPVPGANHKNILQIESDDRYKLLRNGFIGSGGSPAAIPPPRERIVFILHGIRASSLDKWLDSIEEEIKRQDPSAIVIRPGYSYFSAARFAMPVGRRQNIPRFLESYAQILAKHRNAEFNFIGHSNGTYILGQSLERIKGMQFKNVVLAGSVLPVDYPWGQRIAEGQIARVRNDRANRDWPVAILCSGLRGLWMRDVGTGGFDGFPGWQTDENAYFPGDHGAALVGDNVASMVRFALGGEFQKTPNLPSEPGVYRAFSRSMPYLTFLVAVLCLVWWLAMPLWHEGRIFPQRLLIGACVLAVLYVILDII